MHIVRRQTEGGRIKNEKWEIKEAKQIGASMKTIKKCYEEDKTKEDRETERKGRIRCWQWVRKRNWER